MAIINSGKVQNEKKKHFSWNKCISYAKLTIKNQCFKSSNRSQNDTDDSSLDGPLFCSPFFRLFQVFFFAFSFYLFNFMISLFSNHCLLPSIRSQRRCVFGHDLYDHHGPSLLSAPADSAFEARVGPLVDHGDPKAPRPPCRFLWQCCCALGYTKVPFF